MQPGLSRGHASASADARREHGACEAPGLGVSDLVHGIHDGPVLLFNLLRFWSENGIWLP